jgi:hypothetical protein
MMAGVTRRINGLAGEEIVAKKRKLENGNNQLQALKVKTRTVSKNLLDEKSSNYNTFKQHESKQ